MSFFLPYIFLLLEKSMRMSPIVLLFPHVVDRYHELANQNILLDMEIGPTVGI